jgi:HSP20 family protein
MARNEITVRRADTILDEIDQLHKAISQRAYDFFRDGSPSNALDNWLKAENELITRPPVSLTQKDGLFEVVAAVPGVDMKDLVVEVTPEELLIKGQTSHETTSDKGKVHISEIRNGQLFRSLHFPEAIDTSTARAEYKDGMLRLTMAVAKNAGATTKKVDIKVAKVA